MHHNHPTVLDKETLHVATAPWRAVNAKIARQLGNMIRIVRVIIIVALSSAGNDSSRAIAAIGNFLVVTPSHQCHRGGLTEMKQGESFLEDIDRDID
jgi:hypothetical protein